MSILKNITDKITNNIEIDAVFKSIGKPTITYVER
jgi:hypothetical protein